MKCRILQNITFLALLLMLVLGMPGTAVHTQAQEAQPTPANPFRPPDDNPPGDTSPMGEKSRKWDEEKAIQRSLMPAASPQAAGGPDDYGYTYNTSVPYAWVDAMGGPNTGLSQYCSNNVAVSLGFPFKYYENTYSTVYVEYNGALTFNTNGSCDYHGDVPSPAMPNNVIAPYWDHFQNATNKIHTLQGGSAPNRYLVVEWHQMADLHLPSNEYTFEAILYENGDIVFQYQNMTYGSNDRDGVGIEDAFGLTGLAPYGQSGGSPASGTAVRFYRPAAAAHASLTPRNGGAFGIPGGQAAINLTVRNTGETGTDTFDLTAASTWAVTFYRADGVTPLTDTDGDGTVDTGALAQGASLSIMAKVSFPINAQIGWQNTALVTARSSLNTAKSQTATLKVSVPARFAQSYTDQSHPYADFYAPYPNKMVRRQTTSNYGAAPAVATMPNGDVIQVWAQSRRNANNMSVNELYYARYDQWGTVVRPPTQLTDNSWASTYRVYDYDPAVAITPDGHVGVVWYRYQYYPTNYIDNYNIYYLILDQAGNLTQPLTNITNNASWEDNTQFYATTAAATRDNRFVFGWTRYVYDANRSYQTIWYTLFDTGGGQVRPLSQFGSSTWPYSLNLTALADGNTFFTLSDNGQIAIGRLDATGNVLNTPTLLPNTYGDVLDAAQLANGKIVLAWTNWDTSPSTIQYAVLNAALGLEKAATTLPNISPVGDYSVSVTDAAGQAVLTWGDACCDYQPNLYYALLDGNGNLVTSPMVFASDNSTYSMNLPYNGQGNTSLPPDITPPTSAASAPLYVTQAFTVTWSGTDTGSGLTSYDIWVRDGAGNPWTVWLDDVTYTHAVYASGVTGHTYDFRSVARDAAGNVETDFPTDGDAHTTIAAYRITGQAVNNQHQPIFHATVSSSPAPLSPAFTDAGGNYVLYLGSGGTYDLSVSRSGFGSLPPIQSVAVSTNLTGIGFVLPPAVDAMTNGGWETGTLAGWDAADEISATVVVTAAHTGNYGLELLVPDAEDAFPSIITQTVTVTAATIQPTLSWVYQGLEAGETLAVMVRSGTQVLSQTFSVTVGEWSHGWLDLSAFSGQEVTITFGLRDTSSGQRIYLDEISLGERKTGVYRVNLPVISR